MRGDCGGVFFRQLFSVDNFDGGEMALSEAVFEGAKGFPCIGFPGFDFFEDLGHAKDVDGAFDVIDQAD